MAFNKVDLSIFIHWLECGPDVRRTALQQFQSFQSLWTQKVSTREVESTDLSYGVPQSSILSFVLFTLYMKPLKDIVQSFKVEH